jgi:hypothetical protein
VCNPATGERVTLPQPSRVPGQVGYSDGVSPPIDTSTAALGFDPSISPHFHVFQLVQELDYYEFIVWAVEIYSSQTGRWVLREAPFDRDLEYVQYTGQMTYFKGFLHFCMIRNSVVSVDTEGKTWRISRVRQNGGGSGSSVCHSQDRLLYVDSNLGSSDAMSIYVLEDHDSEEWIWIFKQSINMPDLFGPRMPGRTWDYYTAAFHPDSDLIFFYDWLKKRLVSYDMKHRDVHVICTLEVPYFEFLPTEDVHRKFFPYVPLYSGALPSSSLS